MHWLKLKFNIAKGNSAFKWLQCSSWWQNDWCSRCWMWYASNWRNWCDIADAIFVKTVSIIFSKISVKCGIYLLTYLQDLMKLFKFEAHGSNWRKSTPESCCNKSDSQQRWQKRFCIFCRYIIRATGTDALSWLNIMHVGAGSKWRACRARTCAAILRH